MTRKYLIAAAIGLVIGLVMNFTAFFLVDWMKWHVGEDVSQFTEYMIGMLTLPAWYLTDFYIELGLPLPPLPEMAPLFVVVCVMILIQWILTTIGAYAIWAFFRHRFPSVDIEKDNGNKSP